MYLICLGPLTLSSTYADQESVEDSNKFMEEVIPLLEKKEELEALPKDVQDFLKLMESFSIAEQGVAKVVKSRIYSLTWHPSNSKLLVAAGDRGGSIGKHLICISEVDSNYVYFKVFGMSMLRKTSTMACVSMTSTPVLSTPYPLISSIRPDYCQRVTMGVSVSLIFIQMCSKRFTRPK